jgi:hypothetical protein
VFSEIVYHVAQNGSFSGLVIEGIGNDLVISKSRLSDIFQGVAVAGGAEMHPGSPVL